MTSANYNKSDIAYTIGENRILEEGFLRFLVANNLIVESHKGGLVMGPSHQDGGIQIITLGENDCFWNSEMEGWEYIINPSSSATHGDELKKINGAHNRLTDQLNFTEYDVPDHITILDCSPVEINGVLFTRWLLQYSTSQWIISRESTKRHLERLNQINKELA